MAYRHNLKPGNKYGNKKTAVDGITFDSKKEALYYQKLKLARQAGELLVFMMQVSIPLPGGIRYRADFIEYWRDGRVRYVDVKGCRTEAYKIKKKLFDETYWPLVLEEV